MGSVILDQIFVTPLKRIPVAGGDVLHAIKRTDPGFVDFGEAYFSIVEAGAVKAWKKHLRMTLNLVVPIGEVKFVFFADNNESQREETIGTSNYVRLTVPPGIWFGFQGLANPSSMLMNLADIEHVPDEIVRKEQDGFKYSWEVVQ